MTGWQALPAGRAPALGADDVDVWRMRLAQSPAQLAILAATLSPDEHARAAKFYFDRDRDAYIAARGVLRALAGGYAGVAPGALVFGYRDKGKPYLEAPAGELQLNVSHSGEFALLAFARRSELGVDVEQRRPMEDLVRLAEASFTAHEYAVLCGLAAADQSDAFFACWSRKEAFIKATGEGIGQLAAFDVSLAPGEPARLLRVDGCPPGELRWSMHELPAIPGHAAALVVESHRARIRCWDWLPVA